MEDEVRKGSNDGVASQMRNEAGKKGTKDGECVNVATETKGGRDGCKE
jgi:hypothetical protein